MQKSLPSDHGTQEQDLLTPSSKAPRWTRVSLLAATNDRANGCPEDCSGLFREVRQTTAAYRGATNYSLEGKNQWVAKAVVLHRHINTATPEDRYLGGHLGRTH